MYYDYVGSENLRPEFIKLGVTDIEIRECRAGRELQILIARKIHLAVQSAALRPWREVLASDTE